MKQLRQQPVNIKQPSNVQWQWVDVRSGHLSSANCSGAMYIPLLADHVPSPGADCGFFNNQDSPEDTGSASAPVASDNPDNLENLIRESDSTDGNSDSPARVISSGSYEQ
jgi:penicillin-binding protein 1B